MLTKCTSSVAFDEPPSEFRIWRAGLNTTTKGDFYFTEKSAESVMAHYRQEGLDVMIDLNHDAITEEVLLARKDAADAMGWCGLEVRNGELWAVNVKWAPEGEERIRLKKQRYISPYFAHTDDGEIRYVVNLALVAMPATHGASALIAASRLSPQGVKKSNAHFDRLNRAAKFSAELSLRVKRLSRNRANRFLSKYQDKRAK